MTHYGGQASDGQRAMHLQKKREREQEELELRKRKLEDTLKVPKLFLEVFFVVMNSTSRFTEMISRTLGIKTACSIKSFLCIFCLQML